MGAQGSRTSDKKLGRTKSNLNDKAIVNEYIIDFASNLNSLGSLATSTFDKFEYVIFQKMPFVGKFNPLPYCNKISNSNQSVFICYDCSLNDQAYLCEGCFEKGNHDGHRFSVFPNNNQWSQRYCRCGDNEFIKKNTICETHKQVKSITTLTADQKQKKNFTAHFNEILKTLFSLKNKNREHTLLSSFFKYLNKLTENNLYYSKMFCGFLLEKSTIEPQISNLHKLLKTITINETSYFRNLSFAGEFKQEILKEIIIALNNNPTNVNILSELLINFSGKMDLLNQLAKDENLVLGTNSQQNAENGKFTTFYSKIIQSQLDVIQIWKCFIRNKLIKRFIKNEQIIQAIIKSLYLEKNNEEIAMSLLQQFLDCQIGFGQPYVIPILMILSPECVISLGKNKFKGFDKKIQGLFANYYEKIFSHLNTHQRYQVNYEDMLVILPLFSFGEATLNKFWEQFQRRVLILQKNKERATISEASLGYFEFLTALISKFFSWEHFIVEQANRYKFKSFIQNKGLIEKLLIENFDKNEKMIRSQMLANVDNYTQGERSLAKEVIKKYLRWNPKKGKYYFIADKLPNNLYNFEELNIGSPFKLPEWQQNIVGKIFIDTLYKFIPNLIKISQKGLMEDLQMVKLVSNVAIALSLLHKDQKKILKDTTRKFIKQIPDVKEDVYYVLAAIRDRFELDIDEAEDEGMRGRKKVKLDLITEIRDKKFKKLKQKQDKALKAWINQSGEGGELNDGLNHEELQEDSCHVCKQKDSQNNRLVFPCNFTRNNIVSTLLKSEVTDLDINICLHKIHESCYEKITVKRQCPVCKFKINCYVPERPLNDESYTKNWLRNFENIVTHINLESGKSFNSDWATIFMTYLTFSRSFKVLLKNSQIQNKQRNILDQTLVLHYKNQLHRWPQLTNQAISRAEKTVKGQVRRESNIKKAVKSLTLDLLIQEIKAEPIKNEKRIEKKVREMINIVGLQNSQKISNCFQWCRDNEAIQEIFQNNIQEETEHQELFKIRELPKTAKDYLLTTSIKCPMCGKYQPSTWECLFCEKISCGNCINTRFHSQRDHRGSCIFLHLNNAQYELIHENREIQKDSLYRNQFEEGWKRNLNPQGWKASTDQVYKFFNSILHSENVAKECAVTGYQNFNHNNNRVRPGFGGFGQTQYRGGFGNTQQFGVLGHPQRFGGFVNTQLMVADQDEPEEQDQNEL